MIDADTPSPAPPSLAAPAAASSGRRPSARYENKRQRILDVATALLNERGVAGMTFQEVALALSLKTTSVIYYFRYKELLAASVFEDSLDRLGAMVGDAGSAASPEARVGRYLELYFDQAARALRGDARPLAILSEIRVLDEERRQKLIARYQALFRAVRAFFGDSDDPARKRILTARTHLLNEALFWSTTWLPRYAIGDFPNVRQRLFDILHRGIGTPGTAWAPSAFASNSMPDEPGPWSAFMRVATRQINQFGYKGASVDRIMREMGLTKGSFYHHIDTKDDLVLECCRDSYRRLTRIQSVAEGQGGTRWQRLASSIAMVLAHQFAGEDPMLRVTGLQALPRPLRDHAIALGDREALWLGGLLFEGMREGSVRLVDPAIGAHVIMSTINAAYDMRTWAGAQTLDEAIACYAGLLTTGIFD